MDQIFPFLLNHWMLSLLLLIILLLIVALEMRGKLSGLKMLSPQAVTQFINQNDAMVIDIRDAENFKKGHITGATNIPADQWDQKIRKLHKFKDKPVIITCKLGQQSSKFAEKLKAEGFTDSYVLKGGLQAWQEASMPLVKH